MFDFGFFIFTFIVIGVLPSGLALWLALDIKRTNEAREARDEARKVEREARNAAYWAAYDAAHPPVRR